MRGMLASIEDLSAVHDGRELEPLKAAAGGGQARLHPGPGPQAPPRGCGPDILGSCFVLRVDAKIPHRSEGDGYRCPGNARKTKPRSGSRLTRSWKESGPRISKA